MAHLESLDDRLVDLLDPNLLGCLFPLDPRMLQSLSKHMEKLTKLPQNADATPRLGMCPCNLILKSQMPVSFVFMCLPSKSVKWRHLCS